MPSQLDVKEQGRIHRSIWGCLTEVRGMENPWYHKTMWFLNESIHVVFSVLHLHLFAAYLYLISVFFPESHWCKHGNIYCNFSKTVCCTAAAKSSRSHSVNYSQYFFLKKQRTKLLTLTFCTAVNTFLCLCVCDSAYINYVLNKILCQQILHADLKQELDYCSATAH